MAAKRVCIYVCVVIQFSTTATVLRGIFVNDTQFQQRTGMPGYTCGLHYMLIVPDIQQYVEVLLV